MNGFCEHCGHDDICVCVGPNDDPTRAAVDILEAARAQVEGYGRRFRRSLKRRLIYAHADRLTHAIVYLQGCDGNPDLDLV